MWKVKHPTDYGPWWALLLIWKLHKVQQQKRALFYYRLKRRSLKVVRPVLGNKAIPVNHKQNGFFYCYHNFLPILFHWLFKVAKFWGINAKLCSEIGRWLWNNQFCNNWGNKTPWIILRLTCIQKQLWIFPKFFLVSGEKLLKFFPFIFSEPMGSFPLWWCH